MKGHIYSEQIISTELGQDCFIVRLSADKRCAMTCTRKTITPAAIGAKPRKRVQIWTRISTVDPFTLQIEVSWSLASKAFNQLSKLSQVQQPLQGAATTKGSL